jgi:hypothetical protein
MPVREYTDSRGVEWRAWDVTPQHMHPATRREDYMANFQDGWLAFESATEKRRLEPPYPADWFSLKIPELEALCRRASAVRRAGETSTGKQRDASAREAETEAMQSAHAQRTFRSPGGREWTVRIHECLDRAGDEQMVLRFTTEDIVVELSHWPTNWYSATVAEFGLMLLDANPPRRRKKGEGPQRRHDDRITLDDGGPSTSPDAGSSHS